MKRSSKWWDTVPPRVQRYLRLSAALVVLALGFGIGALTATDRAVLVASIVVAALCALGSGAALGESLTDEDTSNRKKVLMALVGTMFLPAVAVITAGILALLWLFSAMNFYPSRRREPRGPRYRARGRL